MDRVCATCLWVMRLDQCDQSAPPHDLCHLDQKALTTGLLALTGVFEIGKAHLAHGMEAYSEGAVGRRAISALLTICTDLFGESPGKHISSNRLATNAVGRTAPIPSTAPFSDGGITLKASQRRLPIVTDRVTA